MAYLSPGASEEQGRHISERERIDEHRDIRSVIERRVAKAAGQGGLIVFKHA
jgi:hypothetical protein